MSPIPSTTAAAPTAHSWLNMAPVKAIAGVAADNVWGFVVVGVVDGAGVVGAMVEVPGEVTAGLVTKATT